MVFLGVGMGFVFMSTSLAAQNSVDLPRMGVATGLVNFTRQLGGAIGVAIASSVMVNALDRQAAHGVPGLAPRRQHAARADEVGADPGRRGARRAPGVLRLPAPTFVTTFVDRVPRHPDGAPDAARERDGDPRPRPGATCRRSR